MSKTSSWYKVLYGTGFQVLLPEHAYGCMFGDISSKLEWSLAKKKQVPNWLRSGTGLLGYGHFVWFGSRTPFTCWQAPIFFCYSALQIKLMHIQWSSDDCGCLGGQSCSIIETTIYMKFFLKFKYILRLLYGTKSILKNNLHSSFL